MRCDEYAQMHPGVGLFALRNSANKLVRRNNIMSWNISIIAVKTNGDDLSLSIPDVFYLTEEQLHFEDASSVMMGSDLSIGRSNNFHLLIDVNCRANHSVDYLTEVSEDTDAYTFQISEDVDFKHYKNGELLVHIQNLEELKTLMKSLKIESADSYGETLASDLFSFYVSEKFPLFDIHFYRCCLD